MFSLERLSLKSNVFLYSFWPRITCTLIIFHLKNNFFQTIASKNAKDATCRSNDIHSTLWVDLFLTYVSSSRRIFPCEFLLFYSHVKKQKFSHKSKYDDYSRILEINLPKMSHLEHLQYQSKKDKTVSCFAANSIYKFMSKVDEYTKNAHILFTSFVNLSM